MKTLGIQDIYCEVILNSTKFKINYLDLTSNNHYWKSLNTNRKTEYFNTVKRPHI